LRFLSYVSASVSATLVPAGLQASIGIISHSIRKDPLDPTWRNDPEIKAYVAWMNKDYPQPDINNLFIFEGYTNAEALMGLLRLCHGNFSRENVMRVVTHRRDFRVLACFPRSPSIRHQLTTRRSR
jgi:branched-chain amino acid transport system substrate-binding protein